MTRQVQETINCVLVQIGNRKKHVTEMPFEMFLKKNIKKTGMLTKNFKI